MRVRSRSDCWPSSARRSRPCRGEPQAVIDGGATLTRRLERYRASTRGILAPARPSVAAGDLARRLADALDGEVVRTAEGVIVRCEDAEPSPPRRSGPARDPPRAAAGRDPARLPRHGDDGPRDGRRDGRLPHRPRLVGGGPLPAGPAPPPRPRRGAGAPDRARGRDPARRLARHLQRAVLRLAAAGRPLPARPASGAGPRRTP